ncbi:protein-L-isoaspartate(D-aspartate) O-methyltransferase [Bartonella sp. HY329]|uniref:protein-L-isoaspartate(D-aspartate) O-methyltransferase n=1 Tax=unclassified Bartonella TaxID=2645622 RepID=UPI0021C6EA2B|nr:MULTISPECIES: protein-L-isoaspartate(D-aspartate) O-methyltransferase [unclassified Bartonella]UXM96264.1 protein-L-isoaspartate(D-aspartate) O-methyltransferase [Bartonella sp. HY329]UXN10588.1 protein-L-isoaspartate(D-aspartate) O-methyltransferase [Bartonella sp. HY328]
MVAENNAMSEYEALANLALRLRSKGIDVSNLLSALEQTPRRNFMDPAFCNIAYSNSVIPIDCGEYIERLDEQLILINALQLEKKSRVLEIGTGSGFTAALIARFAGMVTTVERYKTLCDEARIRFQNLMLDNIILRQADAMRGISFNGPFDRIIIWPSMVKEPLPYMELLAGNGILLVPLGVDDGMQTIIRYSKTGTRFERSDMFKVRYQPFIEGVAEIL